MGTLDYHSFLANYPDNIVKQQKWTRFTEPLYDEDDYKEFRSKNDAYKEFKGELEVLDKYANFDHTKIDSYQISKLINTSEMHKKNA